MENCYILINLDRMIYKSYMPKALKNEAEKSLIPKQACKSLLRKLKNSEHNYLSIIKNTLNLHSIILGRKKHQAALDINKDFARRNSLYTKFFIKNLVGVARQNENTKVILVTSLPHTIAQPLATEIGADDVISSQLEVSKGRFTKRLNQILQQDEKTLAFARKGISKDNTLAAFVDSIYNTDIFDLAKYPYCVKPDKELRKEAKKNGWIICNKYTPIFFRQK